MKKLLLVALIVGLTGPGGAFWARADEATQAADESTQADGLRGQQELAARIKAASEARVQAREALKKTSAAKMQAQKQAMKIYRKGHDKKQQDVLKKE